MKYNDAIEVIVNNNTMDRMEVIIKDMCRLTTDILDYDYTLKNYNGNGTVIEDQRNKIKNSLAILESDLDIYKKMLGINEDVFATKAKRVTRIAEKILKR